MITLHQTQQAMNELIVPGKYPNGKVACWIATLTIQQPLFNTSRRARVIKQYAHTPLPTDRSVLRQQLYLPGILGGVPMWSVVHTLYAVETLWNEGKIDVDAGLTFASQSAWRARMCKLIPGMGAKSVSFALHLYDPAHCQILAVDRWHLRRLGKSVSAGMHYPQYLACEQRLLNLCHEVAETDDRLFWWPVTYAAYLWESARQAAGMSMAREGEYEYHGDLSVFIDDVPEERHVPDVS